jgi:hypothetical protein
MKGVKRPRSTKGAAGSLMYNFDAGDGKRASPRKISPPQKSLNASTYKREITRNSQSCNRKTKNLQMRQVKECP